MIATVIELFFGLIGLGVLAVIILVLDYEWQEYKAEQLNREAWKRNGVKWHNPAERVEP